MELDRWANICPGQWQPEKSDLCHGEMNECVRDHVVGAQLEAPQRNCPKCKVPRSLTKPINNGQIEQMDVVLFSEFSLLFVLAYLPASQLS